MLSRKWNSLYWHTNKDPMMGFDPGELICAECRSGGGFAGAPEVLIMREVKGIAPGQPPPLEPVEFPFPSNSVEYRVGGHLFSGYTYHENTKGATP